MEIVVMRHGKPKIDKNLRLNAAEFGVWVEKYKTSGIDTEHQPPQAAIERANRCAFTVCSNLPRSLASAKILGIVQIGSCDALIREMEMPHAAWHFPRLSLLVWSVFFRLAWACGYSANTESFKAAKERARGCAEHLADLASTHGTVLFVGHGLLNWFIGKYLKNIGWSRSGKLSGKYWEYSTYHVETT